MNQRSERRYKIDAAIRMVSQLSCPFSIENIAPDFPPPFLGNNSTPETFLVYSVTYISDPTKQGATFYDSRNPQAVTV
jgi:hypothetical protein